MRNLRTSALWGVVSSALIATACTHHAQSPLPAVKTATVGKDCARIHVGGAVRRGTTRASSPVALAKSGPPQSHTLAYVADADEPTLHTIDVDTQSELATTPLIGRPEHVLVLGDGRVAVTLRASNALQILEPTVDEDAALETRCVVGTRAEPIALATTPDDRILLVTSGWGHSLSGYDAETLAPAFEASLPRDPRSAVVSADGSRAFVAHVVGARMSVVDLSTADHTVRTIDLAAHGEDDNSETPTRKGCQGFAVARVDEESDFEHAKPHIATARADDKSNGKLAKMVGRVFAPMVSVNPGDGASETSGYGEQSPSEVSEVAVVDVAAERSLTRVVHLPNESAAREPCLLPRAAAYGGGALYLTCLGIDALLELDARAVDPARAEIRRWSVASGPTGVAVDGDAHRAVVWSQFDREISFIKLGDEEAAPAARLALARSPAGITANVAQGRRLFHRVADSRISSDGRACASCHPDGREDALTWSTPDGARQTPMLAGRLAETAPYGWMGTSDAVKEHLKKTFERLGGEGLPKADLTALLDYVGAMAPPAGNEAFTPTPRIALAKHGRALFEAAETGCSTCHDSGHGFADGLRHRVTARLTDSPNDAFDTPSLRFVSGTAPYFHDGRYKTLDDVLTAPDHKMGTATQLDRSDRAALVAYLETL